MAVDRTQDTYRGLLLPEPTIKDATINATDSSYSESDPKPGVAVDQSTPNSAMVLRTSGQQTAQTTLNVQTQRGGFSGREDYNAGFVHKLSTDSSTEWLGYDVPNVITGWEWLRFNSGSLRGEQFDLIRLQNGDVLSVERSEVTTPNSGIMSRTFDADAGTWTAHNLNKIQSGDWSATLPAKLYPCLVQLPSGRVLCYFYARNTDLDQAQVQMYYSDDDGQSWTLGSRFCLENVIDTSQYNLHRLRASYNQGQILLLADIDDTNEATLTGRVLRQWASDDEGVFFTEVATIPSASEQAEGPVIYPLTGGGFQVVYYDGTNDTNEIEYRVLDNAFHDITTESATEIAPSASIDYVTGWVDEAGIFYLLMNVGTGDNTIIQYRSLDEGTTWERMDSAGSGTVEEGLWFAREAGNYPDEFVGISTRGRGIILSNVVTNSTTYDDGSILALYAGGYTDFTNPLTAALANEARQGAHGQTWISIEEPESIGDVWSKATAGAPTVTVTSDGLRLQAGNTDTVVYSLADSAGASAPSGVDQEFIVYIEGALTEGGSSTVDKMVLQIKVADGVDDYDAKIRFTDAANSATGNAGYRVLDTNGSSTDDVDFDITSAFEMKVMVVEGKVKVYHRAKSADGEINRGGWTAGVETTLTSDTSTPDSKNDIIWGCNATDNITTDMHWKTVCYLQLDAGLVGLQDGFTNPDDLAVRPYSKSPVSLYQGTRIAAVDGPTVRGESWNIPARALYGIENIDPAISPSPRQTWRTTDTSQQTIVWDITANGDDGLFAEGVPIAIAILGANWRTATLSGITALSAKTTIATIDMGSGTSSLKYIRNGYLLRPGPTSGNAGRWIDRSELIDGTVNLDSDTDIRRITKNTGGYWTVGETTSPRPRIYAEDIDDTEGATGDIDIWVPAAVFFIREIPTSGGYEKIELVIDSQSTAEGYLETGTILIGSVAVFGRDYSWGREITTETNVDVTTRRGGTRYSRKLGPDRRLVEFGWAEGIDSTSIHDLDADYAQMGSSSPATVASPANTPDMVEGILRGIDGPDTLVVYLASIDGTTDSQVDIMSRDAFVYGRTGDQVTRQVILGEEEDTEVMRVSSIEITEEV